ncbi:hypothetical protein [Tsuneonella dongtanensis]|nr:hypothetical protein [Tsuneonella dongtanensis]
MTGHRARHPAWRANVGGMQGALDAIFDKVEAALGRTGGEGPHLRVLTLLADGMDQLAANEALKRDYELVVTLPFAPDLSAAINDAGQPTETREALDRLLAASSVFALTDHDALVEELMERHRGAPDDERISSLLDAEISRRVAVAGQVMIEQIDFLIAAWDGETTAFMGGTGHTVAAALAAGCPVVRIDPARPSSISVIRSLEGFSLEGDSGQHATSLDELLLELFAPPPGAGASGAEMSDERWHPTSGMLVHAYRRVESLFGQADWKEKVRPLRQRYEPPSTIAEGSAAPLMATIGALPGVDSKLVGRIGASVLPHFAWADGISTFLSDAYRSGMTVNFVLSSLAVVGGLSYLPLVGVEHKWAFALFELCLLAAIIAITWIGRRQRWHERWFATRRVAEYLRAAPVLLPFGIARARGRWPRGSDTVWPEAYARQVIRQVGLPRMTVTEFYLRAALSDVLRPFVESQRAYHVAKAARLARVHHRLDHLSEVMFVAAVAVVATFVLLHIASTMGVVDQGFVAQAAKWFTLFGVALPTFGAAVAGIRYFGDFERFAAISRVTAEKLGVIGDRINMLLQNAGSRLTYERAAALAHATEEVMFSEIESWQGVFGGKRISIPV